MTNEIDKQIQTDIAELSGYSLQTFRTRFNGGTYDAFKVMDTIQTKYSRYITRDYTRITLGLLPYRFQQYVRARNATAKSYQ